eukprot:3312583-Amphidinium_carterae.3
MSDGSSFHNHPRTDTTSTLQPRGLREYSKVRAGPCAIMYELPVAVGEKGSPELKTEQCENDHVQSINYRVVTYNALSMNGNDNEKHNGLRRQGQLTHLAGMLIAQDIDACLLQETRLELPDSFEMKDFFVQQVSAQAGYGGLAIMVRKTPQTKIINTSSPHHRRLSAIVLFHSRRVHLVSAHAPTQVSPLQCHIEFQREFATLTNSIPDSHYLVIGIDLNARAGGLGAEYDHIIGPFATPHKHPCHIVDLLDHCAQKNYRLTNTLIAPFDYDLSPITPQHPRLEDCVATWQKHGAPLTACIVQIDFIITNSTSYDATTTCYPLPWGHLSTLHHSDHRPVLINLTIRYNSPGHRTKRPLHRSFVNAEHEMAFNVLLRSSLDRYYSEFPWESTCPRVRVEHIQGIASDCLQATAPKKSLVGSGSSQTLDARTHACYAHGPQPPQASQDEVEVISAACPV